jgi:Type IV secretory system Conjugative DNA transfer
VNGDLTPAVIAAGGGSALMAGVWWHEHRQIEAMRASRVRLGLRFPIGLEPSAALAALDGLAGLPSWAELTAEVVATQGAIGFFVWVPPAAQASVSATLTGVIPSLRITEAPFSAVEAATLSAQLFIPTPSVFLADGAVASARTLLSGMVGLRSDEQLILRWALRPGSARRWREPQNPSDRERETVRAWRRKIAAPGFAASGLVLVRSPKTSRARELLSHVENVLRGRRQVGGVRVTRGRGSRTLASQPRTTRTSGWLSTPELLALTGWPLGPDVAVSGVEVGAARTLPVPLHVPRRGRRICIGRDGAGVERPVALTADAARHHMGVVAPSGSGKSVLLARAILDDIENGFAGAVIDPKADLIETVLNHVKPEHADRVVVLDPADHRPIPGVAVLAGGDPDLRADVLTGALRSAFPTGAWGVRTDFYLRLAIRTLAEVPGATLADIGRLFFEEPFRRRAIGRLGDPFLASAWQSYSALSAGAQAERVQAPMARVTGLLTRPAVRAVLASPTPKLDVGRLFAERKWLLISLAPGAIGEPGAAIIGAALMYVIWSAIEARVALPPEKRHPIFLYVDELATLTGGLPFRFELLAERARGLGAGLTVAIQTLSRIPEPTRSAVLGNTMTFISFRAGAEEASQVARQLPGLSAADVMGLARFEVAARIGTGVGGAVSTITGRTEPLPPPTGQAEAIRDASAARYGSDPQPLEAPTQTPEPSGEDAPLGRAGRGM